MDIQNNDAINIIKDQAKLAYADGWPSTLAPVVQPIIDMTPDFHRAGLSATASSGASGSVTVYTGVAGKKFFITGFLFSISKDATCDIASGNPTISYTQGGIAKTLCGIAVITLTAERDSIHAQLAVPIPIDTGTSISMSGTFTVGVLRRFAAVYGYEVNA